MSRLLLFLLGIVCGAVLTMFAAQTQLDPVKISPQYYKVRLDNDRVRVLEYHLPPGQKESMHSHPPGLVYVLSTASLRSTSPDGKSAVVEGTAGEVFWRETATSHSVENISTTESAAIAVELKPCSK